MTQPTPARTAPDLAPVDPSRLVEVSPDCVFVLDTVGNIRYVNPAGEAMLGRSAGEYLGHNMADFLHPDDLALAVSSLETVQAKAVGTPIELRVAAPLGHWRWVEVIGRDCRHVAGVGGIVFGARDLTQRRMWEVAANDVARFQQIVQHAAAVVLSLDSEGVITSVNGALNRLLGLDPSLAIGTRLVTHATAGHQRNLAEAMAAAGIRGIATAEVSMRHARSGESIPMRLEIVDLRDDPVVAGFVVTGQDVSDLDAARRRLEHLATHDALTGLPNRALLHERLQALLEIRRPLALLYVDLDQFKPVNDAHGHDVGDQLLRLVARRLTNSVAATDLVARVGGDEFVVVALDIAEGTSAAELAARLETTLSAPYRLDLGPVQVGASVGSVLATPQSTLAGLLAQADFAMYAAKSTRRDLDG